MYVFIDSLNELKTEMYYYAYTSLILQRLQLYSNYMYLLTYLHVNSHTRKFLKH